MSELRDNVIMHINFCKQADNPVSDNHHVDEIIALVIAETKKVVDGVKSNDVNRPTQVWKEDIKEALTKMGATK